MNGRATRCQRLSLSGRKAVSAWQKLAKSAAWVFLATSTFTVLADPLTGCGPAKPFERCDAANRCDRSAVFEVPDAWHGLAQCMRKLRDRWSRGGPESEIEMGKGLPKQSVAALVRLQVTREMAKLRVQFGTTRGGHRWRLDFAAVNGLGRSSERSFDLVVLSNDRDLPYNAMGQSGLAYFLYQLAALADRGDYPDAEADTRLYRRLARGVIMTVLTPVSEGGLASSSSCTAKPRLRCTWYHSITRRDQPTRAGATLNQHLHAVRDLGLIADHTERLGWNEGIDFNRAALEGVNQLALYEGNVRPGATPNLQDFLATPTGTSAVRWAYYGLNPLAERSPRGYFLNSKGRDCNYHLHVLELLEQILGRANAKASLDHDVAQTLFACKGPLAELQRAVRLRKSRPPIAWSTAGVRDFSCPRLGTQYNGNTFYTQSRFASCS